MTILLWLLIAFLVGSLPSGYLVARLAKGIDIRRHGSGNPGATNVFRVVGPAAGIVTFLVDTAKGYLPVVFAAGYFGSGAESVLAPVAVGLAALAGHIWSVFLSFRGGKGVATGMGVFLALMPVPTIVAAAVFSAVLGLTRYVSLGSITAALALPVAAVAAGEPAPLVAVAVLVFVIIVIKHRGNIERLRAGREHKVGQRTTTPNEGDDTHE